MPAGKLSIIHILTLFRNISRSLIPFLFLPIKIATKIQFGSDKIAKKIRAKLSANKVIKLNLKSLIYFKVINGEI